MAGKASNLSGAWKDLAQHLELEPSTEFHGGTYLGQVQYDVKVDQRLLDAQKLRWESLFQDVREGEYDSSMGNLTAKDQRHKAENPKIDLEIPADSGILDSIIEEVPAISAGIPGDPKPKGKAKKPKAKNMLNATSVLRLF